MMRNIPVIVLVVLISGVWAGGAHGEMKTDLKKARDPFRPVELKTLKTVSGANPGMVVYQAIAPGRQRQTGSAENLKLEFISATQAVAILDLLNLNDRVTKDLRYRIELLQQKNGTWSVLWVGVRNRCQEGRGAKGWSKTPCQ